MLAIQPGNGQCRQGKIVGQKRDAPFVVFVGEAYPAKLFLLKKIFSSQLHPFLPPNLHYTFVKYLYLLNVGTRVKKINGEPV